VRDLVFVNGLEARTILGVDEWERVGPQPVSIDLAFLADAAAAARSDDVRDTVNYRDVAKAVLELAEASRFRLVETLAERIAERVLREFGRPWVRVRVVKRGAVRFAREVGVEIERGARDGGR
jgi:dihydroneopterin aldolase